MMDDLIKENVELEERKEAEQTRAEETIRREQQQMRQLEQVKGSPGIFRSLQHVPQQLGTLSV